jgi:hypothetical protein
MLRVFGRVVLALLLFCLLAVAIWIWMARGCLGWDPPPDWHPAANCTAKAGTARLAWVLSFLALIFWAVQPAKRPQRGAGRIPPAAGPADRVAPGSNARPGREP